MGHLPINRTWFYRLSGALIESDIPLPSRPGSPPHHDDGRPIALRLAPVVGGEPRPPGSWQSHDHGSVNKTPDGFLLHLVAGADFWIARDGTAVVCSPSDACGTEAVAQLFVDQVLPLVLHVRGQFAFHGSSVAFAGHELVGFLGRSGAGKSTLASSFARDASALLFSDDCLAVEVAGADIRAHPSYASTRLWSESAGALFADRGALPLASPRTDKLRAMLPVAREPLPLRRLYLLTPTDGKPAVTRLSRRDALVELTAHLYRLDPEDRVRLAGELDLLEKVVSRVPVARLAYRHAYAELPAVRAAIVGDLKPPG